MSDLCTDNRFELIEKYKKKLIDATNIEMAQDEMAVIDDILFRFWQMGWLDKLDADAVPVKHGEWIDDGGLYRCSSCNHLWSELWWTENCPIERMLKIMPYCPNCGADMRERKDDETY